MLSNKVPTRTCIALVEDDPEMCMSIKAMMASIGLETIVFNAGSDFLDTQSLDSIGCVVTDLRLPDISGLQVVERAIEKFGYCPPTIMISGYADVPTAVSAIKNGVIDFLEKPFIPQDLIDQVQKALMIDQENRSLHALSERISSGLERLTIRERQVLKSLLDCKSNKQISAELKLSSKTIASHRANILTKCESESLLELAGNIQSCKVDI
ncbi:response regulator transcription factor [Planctomycetota bacterium]|nr:response regulator transcription factor [Planctomycetota bacterium]